MSRGYARGRARDDAIRATLEPLRRGERPAAVTVAALLAAGLALAEVVPLVLDGFDDRSRLGRSVVTVCLLGVMAWGLWRARYWAVLGMQALLGLTIVVAAIALVTASNLSAVLLVVAIIALSGALFWSLVKALARIQMPERPGGPE